MNPVYIILPIFIGLLGLIFTTNQYSALEIIIFLFFVIMIVIMGTNYFFGIQLTTTLNNLFNQPEVNVAIVEPTEQSESTDSSGFTGNVDQEEHTDSYPEVHEKKTFKSQVYHVQGRYDYPTAKAVCKAYHGKLATIQQMNDAYKKGAEWCDYGWSKDSTVLYPTQLSSWKKYQKTEHKEQCGIPGVNGGYNLHPEQKLGINCFGPKPDGKMPDNPMPIQPVDENDSYWQNKNLSISPFNYTAWSEL